MLQLEFADSIIGPKLFKTWKVFDNNTGEIASLEFDKLMWKNRWNLIFCWKVAFIVFNLDICDALDDLHDEFADRIGD